MQEQDKKQDCGTLVYVINNKVEEAIRKFRKRVEKYKIIEQVRMRQTFKSKKEKKKYKKENKM